MGPGACEAEPEPAGGTGRGPWHQYPANRVVVGRRGRRERGERHSGTETRPAPAHDAIRDHAYRRPPGPAKGHRQPGSLRARPTPARTAERRGSRRRPRRLVEERSARPTERLGLFRCPPRLTAPRPRRRKPRRAATDEGGESERDADHEPFSRSCVAKGPRPQEALACDLPASQTKGYERRCP